MTKSRRYNPWPVAGIRERTAGMKAAAKFRLLQRLRPSGRRATGYIHAHAARQRRHPVLPETWPGHRRGPLRHSKARLIHEGMFKIVILDDGSKPPLTHASLTLPDVKIMCQEHHGFGFAQARNIGARAAP